MMRGNVESRLKILSFQNNVLLPDKSILSVDNVRIEFEHRFYQSVNRPTIQHRTGILFR